MMIFVVLLSYSMSTSTQPADIFQTSLYPVLKGVGVGSDQKASWLRQRYSSHWYHILMTDLPTIISPDLLLRLRTIGFLTVFDV